MANDAQHHLGAASLAIGAPAISTGSEAKPVRQRQRKPSVRTMIAQAEKAGKKVVSITMPEGVTFTFGKGEDEEATVTPLDRWMAKRHAN